MSKDSKPLFPIAIRCQHDLKINGKGDRTQQSYVRMLRKFSEFLGRDPNSASEELRVTDLCGCCSSFRPGWADKIPCRWHLPPDSIHRIRPRALAGKENQKEKENQQGKPGHAQHDISSIAMQEHAQQLAPFLARLRPDLTLTKLRT
jgi:hypothetical protein